MRIKRVVALVDRLQHADHLILNSEWHGEHRKGAKARQRINGGSEPRIR